MLDRTTPPPVADMPPVKIDSPVKKVLPNGVELYTLSGGDAKVCRLTILLEGGIADITPQVAPTIIAKMLCEGTSSHSSSEIADILDYNGAILECNATTHYLSLQLMALNRALPTLIPLLVEMITEPTFPEHETSIAVEEKAMQLEIELGKVAYQAGAISTRQIKGSNHPLATVPTPEDIRAITPENLREIYSNIFAPSRIKVFLAGLITPEIYEALETALSSIPASAEKSSPIHIQPNNPLPPECVKSSQSGALQSAVICTIPAIGRNHPDYVPLRIAVMALGGYFGSRLMANIREDKGYTYGINASLVGEHEGGYVKIGAQCDNRFVDALIAEIRNELTRMTTHPLSDEELTRVKRNYMTSLVSRADSPISMMSEQITTFIVGCPEGYFDAQQEALAAVTPESLAAISSKYLNPNLMSIAIAGDI